MLEAGWTRRWTGTWHVSGAMIARPVGDLASFPVGGLHTGAPVYLAGWSAASAGLTASGQHRRHHGFESVAEQRVLVALDFVGHVAEVLAQPFRLRFTTNTDWREHVPDFLAVTQTGRWLIDVRPAGQIKPDDEAAFAAGAEAALWRAGATRWCRDGVRVC